MVLRLALLSLLVVPVSSQRTRPTTGPPRPVEGAGASELFRIQDVEHGFGGLLPYRTTVPDAGGFPTAQVVEIRSRADLTNNVTPANGVLPVASWPTAAVLPNGEPGNHFVAARFTAALDVDSVLTPLTSAAAVSSLTGALLVVLVDPVTGETLPARGRVFVNGATYGSVDPDDPSKLLLERWVARSGFGRPVAWDPRGIGFPGTQGALLAGASALVAPEVLVFVADTDGDLATHETFPPGYQVTLIAATSVRSAGGRSLAERGVASATVGADGLPPEVHLDGPTQVPAIVPEDGAVDVDPGTDVTIQLTEPVQPLSLGSIVAPARPASAIQLEFGPQNQSTLDPHLVRPVSIYDFTRWILDPAFDFPGSAPPGSLWDFGVVDVSVNPGQVEDLAINRNQRAVQTMFRTAQGPGLVNAPVTPDALYLARDGTDLSVLDLNGFGAGTGDPTYDPLNPAIRGNSNYPNNPNVALQGSLLIPPLQVGSSTADGGSSGPLTLTRDTALSDVLVTAPTLQSVGDMALGHALDTTFNGGSPFGCQSGGGNLCATTGLKRVAIAAGPSGSIVPLQPGGTPIQERVGARNVVSWAPHPNPPPLIFPPLCITPALGAQEPTAVDVETLGLQNLLVPSANPFGNPGLGIPPQGLIANAQNAFFEGPSPPQPTILLCREYMQRQQVGHFLYVVDREAGELVVLNSNRMQVLDRIQLPDPTSLAMSPNLDFLAVTNQGADSVSFVDVDPSSSSFHGVVRSVAVPGGPLGIAWEPGNEDILVCSPGSDALTLISAFSLSVRKTVTAHLAAPFEVAVTPRQTSFGLVKGTYFAWVLNGDGSVALFQSGPSGVNGWGYDDIIGVVPGAFANAKALQADPSTLDAAVWITHQEPLAGARAGGGGAVTRVRLTGLVGLQPLVPGSTPSLRGLSFVRDAEIGSDVVTGVPTDLAFDDLVNRGGLRNAASLFSAGVPLDINGKDLAKQAAGTIEPASSPEYLFLSIPSSSEGPGVLDVIELATGQRLDTDPYQPGTQSVPVPGVTGLAHYFRQ